MRRSRLLRSAAFGTVVALSCACSGADAPTESIGESQSPIEHPEAENRSTATVALSWQGRIGCSGTLLGPDTVLTAGHCIHRSLPDAVQRVDGTTWSVARATVHPAFDATTLAHDVAIVRLTAHAPPPYATLSPSRDLTAGTLLTVAGVAAPRARGTYGNYEGTAEVRSLDDARLTLSPAPTTPCGGDSGGSVFLRDDAPWRLVAVISAGDVDCSRVSFATRVDAETPFIEGARADLRPVGGCIAAGTNGSSSVPSATIFLALATLLVAVRICRRLRHEDAARGALIAVLRVACVAVAVRLRRDHHAILAVARHLRGVRRRDRAEAE